MLSLASQTPPGDFAEVGVWRGGSAQRLYELAQARKCELYLFDTFTGIPWKSKYDIHNVGDFGNVDVAPLKIEMPRAQFYVGTFPNTLLGVKEQMRLAFVHEDTDQYESTKAVIHQFYPLLVLGGIMLFDDYTTGDCPGSKYAIDESGLKLRFAAHHAWTVKL